MSQPTTVAHDIQPFVGFLDVRLGMSSSQVRDLLGAPDSEVGEDDGDLTLTFEHVGVSCTFWSEDDGRLGSVALRSPRWALDGVGLVGLKESQLLELADGLLSDLHLEDDLAELGTRSYDCEALGLSFWVRDAVVAHVTMWPRFSTDGERAIWP